ncbi:MAG: hypothetical protein FJ184_04520, partial [Gammaproteobacteria bacterium]|nr:hypothetical protein [Gammaproteobacteria bacterium]
MPPPGGGGPMPPPGGGGPMPPPGGGCPPVGGEVWSPAKARPPDPMRLDPADNTRIADPIAKPPLIAFTATSVI